MQSQSDIKYSLILPVFNEEAVLPLLVNRLKKLLVKIGEPTEVIFVDDGSSDTSPIYLKEIVRTDQRFRMIKLSRNFGHQIAISAGMDEATGQAVIVLDADLQDPPEVVLEMIEKWKQGFEIVYAQRIARKGETFFKKLSASVFYRTMRKLTEIDIPVDTGDFRRIGPKALKTFKAMPEKQRFVRGMFAWMGYRQTAVKFERPERAAGETKYPLSKMIKLASHGVLSFSDKPLRLALWGGALVSTGAALYGLYVFALWMIDASLVEGWASTVMIVSFLSGVNLMMTGIVGLYVGSIYTQVKQRPLYVVDELEGFNRDVKADQTPSTSSDNDEAGKSNVKYL